MFFLHRPTREGALSLFVSVGDAKTRPYRAEIDGLRAVAVTAVILFHAGVPGLKGGFLGVDVFFVISGYVITQIILRDVAAGRFSFGSFFERRVRRIVPALSVMLAACAFMSLILLPADMRRFDDSFLATIAFQANIYFIKTAGYFATNQQASPLLHMWSLSVEEQIYLVFPICLIGAATLGRHRTIVVVSLLMLCTSALQFVFVRVWPLSGYYLPFMRGGEFLVGSALATGFVPQLRQRYAGEAAALSGLVMLVFAFHRFTGSGQEYYCAGLVACVATALVIYGTDAQHSLIRRGLSVKPAIFVGRASYSLYLWHWPFIVFGTYYVIDSSHLPFAMLVCAAASVPVALLSWSYIERPFRGPNAILSRRQAFIAAAAAGSILVCAGGIGRAMHGAPWRFDKVVQRIIDQPEGMLSPCTNQSLASIAQHKYCRIGSASATPNFVLWGDSHADMYYNGLDEMARRYGVSGYIFSQVNCPFYYFDSSMPSASGCAARDALIRGIIASMHPKAVIFAERWNSATVALSSNSALATQWLTAMQSGLERTALFVEKSGARVFIVSDVPEALGVVPDILAKAHIAGYDIRNGPPDALHLEPSMAQYDAMEVGPQHIFSALARQHKITFIEPQTLLCDRKKCLVADGIVPLYRDNHHLSADGARFVSPAFDTLMKLLAKK